MDFKSVKNKVIKAWKTAKTKVVDTTNKAVNFSAKKLSNSSATLRDKKALEDTINRSKNSYFVEKETGKRKLNKNRTIIIFASERSDFFKSALVQYPILKTKAFSQNLTLKLAVSKIDWVNFEDYGIKKMPALVLFENKKAIKTLEWKENIQKLVKSLNLDINELIENL